MMEQPARPGRLEAHVERVLAASDARVVVTGAGGWLGMATLELLRVALGDGFDARVTCFGSSRRSLSLLDGTLVQQRSLEELGLLDAQPTLVLHLAFLTKDRAEAMDADSYAAANRQLRRTVIEALDRIGTTALFVASSGAAAFADDPAAAPAMRLYGQLKREDEEAFAAWAGQGERRAVIARIFNVSGPHINKHRSYALASFILDSLAGRPIEIRAPHRVVRSYVAIRELMSLVFALLLDGKRGITSLDSGGQPMELAEVAAAVAKVVRDVPIERPTVATEPVDQYIGGGAAYRALLAGHRIAEVPFARQVLEVAEFLLYFQMLSSENGVAMEPQSC